MAAQAALIEETIVGLKKALRRENDYTTPDEPITQPTNRGNKLRVNAKHVHEGALGFTNSRELYKKKIEHAGYTRYILRPNPSRYDSEGEEIDDNEEADSEAEAAMAEDNPFAEIALEHILCPLKQASELPDHPTLSQPYKSKALSTMIGAIDEKLRKERALLARAHDLHRQFLGDSNWMPCGFVESEEDHFIFRSRPSEVVGGDTSNQRTVPASQIGSEQHIIENNNTNNSDKAQTDTDSGHRDEYNNAGSNDIEMMEVPTTETDKDEVIKTFKEEDGVPSEKELPRHGESDNADLSTKEAAAAAYSMENGLADNKEEKVPDNTMDSSPHAPDAEGGGDTIMQDTAESKSVNENNNNSSPEPPRRMTTRAQANATTTTTSSSNQPPTGSSRYTSPDAATHITSAHPMFLMPEDIRPDKDFGLPSNEAEDTRRLLWSYIQKQEETVRGFTYMLNSLLRADQLKEDVFEWCKAEGHIGEMSDGEDWYDREKWGLAEGEDLKKGADDDDVDNNVDEGRTTGKRGRRRQ